MTMFHPLMEVRDCSGSQNTLTCCRNTRLILTQWFLGLSLRLLRAGQTAVAASLDPQALDTQTI